MLHFPYEPLLHSCAPNLTLGIHKMFMIFFEPFLSVFFLMQLIVLPGLLARTFFKALSNIHLFFTVWEAGSPRSGCEPGQGEGPLPGCRLLLCPHMVERSRIFNVFHSLVSSKFLSFKILVFSFQGQIENVATRSG